MANGVSADAEKAARWAKAGRYAHGYADHGMGEALKIYYTRYFPLIALTAFGVAMIIAFVRAGDGPVDGWFAAWLGTYLFAISAGIGGLLYNTKRLTPQVKLGSTLSIIMPLEKEEQRALTRGINGKEPVPAEHISIARSLAIQSRKTTATWLLLAPGLIYVFGPVFSSSTSLSWFYLLILAFLVTVMAFMTRSFRRQGHFLNTTTPPPQPMRRG
jgi:hypothetical protein